MATVIRICRLLVDGVPVRVPRGQHLMILGKLGVKSGDYDVHLATPHEPEVSYQDTWRTKPFQMGEMVAAKSEEVTA